VVYRAHHPPSLNSVDMAFRKIADSQPPAGGPPEPRENTLNMQTCMSDVSGSPHVLGGCQNTDTVVQGWGHGLWGMPQTTCWGAVRT
jgi:hypothetical protein